MHRQLLTADTSVAVTPQELGHVRGGECGDPSLSRDTIAWSPTVPFTT